MSSILPLVPKNANASLITVLVERWRPETSTFHWPFGEVTITLEDVVTLTGLAIDGDANIVDIPDEDEFNHLSVNASRETTEQFARAYALSLMRVVLFPDRSRATVHLQYLVEDWQRAGRFSWRAAVLAYLYHEMGRPVLRITHSSSLGGDLGGCVPSLQLWAW
ncbi:unnamed protein product [Linum tenue]|uniref:Aminotransferase-like plant mobile domain-containing protein n=1 Tax=Linum tenue TaxID=586396 RepID=A0AAV0PZ31_9ROSI|nr:unnamed protein product [Linum tenue]